MGIEDTAKRGLSVIMSVVFLLIINGVFGRVFIFQSNYF